MVALVPVVLPSAGSIAVQTRDGVSVLRLEGEIDLETVAAFQRTHPSPRVTTVDLTDVRFLSSSAVAFLVRHTQPVRDRGGLPVIRGISAPARRVLELIGALELFAVAD